MKTRIPLLLLALAAAGMAAAQTPAASAATAAPAPAPGARWTLDDCIGFAQRNNTDVQKQAIQVEQSTNDLSTARFSRLPDLNASVGYNASFGRSTGDDNTYRSENLQTGSFDLSASMPLFQGLRINRTIRGEKLNLSAAVEDLDRAREDVAVNVMTLYLQVLYNKELVGIAERQLALSTQQADRSRSLAEAGKQPESAVYESLALQANDALTLTQARNDLQLALLDLSQAINRESAAGFDIVEPALDSLLDSALEPHPLSVGAVYDYAAENRPHIRAERVRLAGYENSVRLARADLYPSLMLRGGFGTGLYSSMNMDFWPQFRKNSSEFIGLSLNVPIFNRRATRNNIRSAQLSVRRQQLTLLHAEQTLRKEIEQAWYNAEAAAAKYRSATAALASAEVAFTYEQQKADAGRSTVFDFNDAKTRMEKAAAELAQAKYETVFRRKILDYYRGEPLTL